MFPVKIKINIFGFPIRVTLSEKNITEIISVLAKAVGKTKLLAWVTEVIVNDRT
jgi:hypothetical protein